MDSPDMFLTLVALFVVLGVIFYLFKLLKLDTVNDRQKGRLQEFGHGRQKVSNVQRASVYPTSVAREAKETPFLPPLPPRQQHSRETAFRPVEPVQRTTAANSQLGNVRTDHRRPPPDTTTTHPSVQRDVVSTSTSVHDTRKVNDSFIPVQPTTANSLHSNVRTDHRRPPPDTTTTHPSVQRDVVSNSTSVHDTRKANESFRPVRPTITTERSNAQTAPRPDLRFGGSVTPSTVDKPNTIHQHHTDSTARTVDASFRHTVQQPTTTPGHNNAIPPVPVEHQTAAKPNQRFNGSITATVVSDPNPTRQFTSPDTRQAATTNQVNRGRVSVDNPKDIQRENDQSRTTPTPVHSGRQEVVQQTRSSPAPTTDRRRPSTPQEPVQQPRESRAPPIIPAANQFTPREPILPTRNPQAPPIPPTNRFPSTPQESVLQTGNPQTPTYRIPAKPQEPVQQTRNPPTDIQQTRDQQASTTTQPTTRTIVPTAPPSQATGKTERRDSAATFVKLSELSTEESAQVDSRIQDCLVSINKRCLTGNLNRIMSVAVPSGETPIPDQPHLVLCFKKTEDKELKPSEKPLRRSFKIHMDKGNSKLCRFARFRLCGSQTDPNYLTYELLDYTPYMEEHAPRYNPYQSGIDLDVRCEWDRCYCELRHKGVKQTGFKYVSILVPKVG